MPLAPGSRLGPYEIVGVIGAGGMGEVYRARDTRLGRDVAVKILPERFAARPETRARFEREARAVAALSHPNILALHDVGTDGDVAYTVTELLEGATLGQRLGEGALPARKAVEYALQAARGLQAAHDRGLVHRDLKPDNIFITDDGRVKLLDFGLARAAGVGEERDDMGGGAAGVSMVATRGPMTEPGTVLGTVGYMSPEQVRGQPLDARSDLFSFGAVLFEMLTGRRAFTAGTAADTMTAILREDPPEMQGGGRAVPPALDRIVRHCLEKNPAERFQTARDLIFSLEALFGSQASGEAAVVVAPGEAARGLTRAGGAARLIAGLAVGVAIGAAATAWLGRTPPVPPPTLRQLSYSGADSQPSGSPDGRLIAFVSHRDRREQIWLRQQPGGDEIALTTGPDSGPRISPDGSQVLFARREGPVFSLYRVPVVGGDPRRIVEDAYDGDWSPDGRRVVFLRESGEGEDRGVSIAVVDADGNGAHEIAHEAGAHVDFPRWSPDGRLIATRIYRGENSPQGVLLLAPDGTGRRVLAVPPPYGTLTSPAWVGDGKHLVYGELESFATGGGAVGGSGRIIRREIASGRTETLMWVPSLGVVIDTFGPGRLLLDSSTRRSNLLEVGTGRDAGEAAHRWRTRGNSVDRQPAFSPDGQWVIFSSNRSGNLDLWKLSIATGAVRRVTEDAADDWDPAFMPDGRSILWSSSRSGHFEIWFSAADGTGARQLTNDGVDAENPTATPDGRLIVYNVSNPARSGVWTIKPDGTGAARLVPGVWSTPEVSPDGRWVAFRSQSEPRTLQVASLVDGRVLPHITLLPGANPNGRPRWLPDGRRLAFTGSAADGAIGVFSQVFDPGRDTTATRVALSPFDTDLSIESFGISPDGTRIMYSGAEDVSTLLVTEGVPGILPPRRP